MWFACNGNVISRNQVPCVVFLPWPYCSPDTFFSSGLTLSQGNSRISPTWTVYFIVSQSVTMQTTGMTQQSTGATDSVTGFVPQKLSTNSRSSFCMGKKGDYTAWQRQGLTGLFYLNLVDSMLTGMDWLRERLDNTCLVKHTTLLAWQSCGLMSQCFQQIFSNWVCVFNWFWDKACTVLPYYGSQSSILFKFVSNTDGKEPLIQSEAFSRQ